MSAISNRLKNKNRYLFWIAEIDRCIHEIAISGTASASLSAGGGSQSYTHADLDKLRKLRKEIATREHVPPYVVFSDATLRDMCAVQPKTLEEMLEVKGIGEMKLARYGEEFLACLIEN